ncbi:LOW QUALITY PROTEIN: Reverse transcriptase, partial [Phytophthora palmivora]
MWNNPDLKPTQTIESKDASTQTESDSESSSSDPISLPVSGEDEDIPIGAPLSTPIAKLEAEFARCMRVNQEDLDLEPGVYIHEGSERMSQLRDELALLPELKDLSPECDISKADVGVPGRTTPAEDQKLRTILEHHRKIFLGDGNAAPAPARGVVCDLDVGDAKPVAQRPRSVAPHLALKVYELLKKLLETGLIELSESPWASPIVIVLKMEWTSGCVLTTRAMWFMSLDMASGFWAIKMTERPKLISAFVCPFGHFQWVRMPFGLKNAPLVSQAVINNCLWGFVRLPPEEEKLVESDVLEFLNLDQAKR